MAARGVVRQKTTQVCFSELSSLERKIDNKLIHSVFDAGRGAKINYNFILRDGETDSVNCGVCKYCGLPPPRRLEILSASLCQIEGPDWIFNLSSCVNVCERKKMLEWSSSQKALVSSILIYANAGADSIKTTPSVFNKMLIFFNKPIILSRFTTLKNGKQKKIRFLTFPSNRTPERGQFRTLTGRRGWPKSQSTIVSADAADSNTDSPW